MKSDIEIAHEAKLSPISEIAAKLGIDDFEAYGNYKAKIAPRRSDEKGKLILVTRGQDDDVDRACRRNG